MNTLFATTAIVALATANTLAGSLSSAPVNPVRILWNQNSNFGGGIASDNCTSGTSACTAAADDFVVPAGKTWTVKEVDVTGMYYNGSGPASSEDITFYANAKGLPGKVIKTFSKQSCMDTAGSFACTIQDVKLTGGTRGTTYWVSLVANCGFLDCGQWAWATNTTVHRHQAVSKGNGCNSWCQIGSDLAFDLKGKRS